MAEHPTIGVNGIEWGSIQQFTASGVEECFLLRVHGTGDLTTVQLAVRESDLPEVVTRLVHQARELFPEAMQNTPPL